MKLLTFFILLAVSATVAFVPHKNVSPRLPVGLQMSGPTINDKVGDYMYILNLFHEPELGQVADIVDPIVPEHDRIYSALG